MKIEIIRGKARLFAFMVVFAFGFVLAPMASVQAADASCDTNMKQHIRDALQGRNEFRKEAFKNAFTGPASVAQVANTPCISKELDKITSQFSNAPSQFLSGISIGGNSASGIMNKFFQSGFESLNSAASMVPQMMNFQTQASNVLGDLLGPLGGSDAFSGELCGMMLDMVIGYIQCAVPIEIPSFEMSLGGFSLNNLLPEGCAGEAARQAIYSDAAQSAWDVLSQPLTIDSSGRLAPGSLAR